MVGSQENKPVSIAVTTAGQMTIPKTMRDELGITDRVEVEKDGDKIIVTRAKTLDERLAQIDQLLKPSQLKAMRAAGGKTANELRSEMEEDGELDSYTKEHYGI